MHNRGDDQNDEDSEQICFTIIMLILISLTNMKLNYVIFFVVIYWLQFFESRIAPTMSKLK